MSFNSSMDDLSDVTSVNAPGLTLMANTALSTMLPKKRKSKAQPASENSSKRPTAEATAQPNNLPQLIAPQENLTPGPNGATDAPTQQPTSATETPANRINYLAIAGEDPDGLISLAGLQAHFGKDIPGIAGFNPANSRTSQLSVGFQLAVELNSAKRPIFSSAHLISVTEAAPSTLFILPRRDPDGKLIVDVFSLSDMTNSGRKVAVQIGTNYLPPTNENASTIFNPAEAVELIVHPGEMIAAIDHEGLQTFHLMVQAGRARIVDGFHSGDHHLHRPSDKNKGEHSHSEANDKSQHGTQSLATKAKLAAARTVPVFENKGDLTSLYASRMLVTPPSQIQQSVQHEKIKAAASDKHLAELVAQTGTKLPFSYGASGGSLNVLNHLSIAAYKAKHQTIMQMASRVCDRSLCAGSSATAYRYVRTWAATYQALATFGKLEWSLGQDRAIIRAREYAAIPDTTEYSAEYYRLLAGDGQLGGDVSAHRHSITFLQIKIENLFLLIFATTNMKFKYQIKMLQSLDRFTNFLRVKDMGEGNPTMTKFLEVTTLAYLTGLEHIRSSIDSSDLDCEEDIMEAFDAIPDTSPESYLHKLYYRFSIEDMKGVTSMIIRQADFTNRSSASDSTDIFITNLLMGTNHTASTDSKNNSNKSIINNVTNDTTNNKNRKLKKEKKKQNVQVPGSPAVTGNANSNIAGQSPTPPVQGNNKAAVTAAGSANNPNSGPAKSPFCVFFASSTGCRHGSSCKHKHDIPSKNSDDWNKINNLLTKYKVQPSDNFTNAN